MDNIYKNENGTVTRNPYEPVPIVLKKELTPKQVKARKKSKAAKQARKRNRK